MWHGRPLQLLKQLVEGAFRASVQEPPSPTTWHGAHGTQSIQTALQSRYRHIKEVWGTDQYIETDGRQT